MKHIIILLALLFCATFTEAQTFVDAVPPTLYIGTVECKDSNWYDASVNATQDSSLKKILRILFYKEEYAWKSLQNQIAHTNFYPTKGDWTLTFDGKNIGKFHSEKVKLDSQKSTAWSFPRDAHHKILKKNLPTIGEATQEFASWAGNEFRPLIAISEPNTSDPEHWKPFEPDNSELDILFPIYQDYLARSGENFIDTQKSQLRFAKSYKSGNSDMLIQLGMKSDYSELAVDHRIWIYKSHSGEIINITKMIDNKFSQDDFSDDDFSINTLVDAGDYDGNGKSEIIFWSSRYNGDGYVLFYDECTGITDFTWSYH